MSKSCKASLRAYKRDIVLGADATGSTSNDKPTAYELVGASHQALFDTHLVGNAKKPADLQLAKRLTRDIKQAPSWDALQLVVKKHQDHLNFIHVSCALTHLPKIVTPHSLPSSQQASFKAFYANLLELGLKHLPDMRSREVSNLLWASAKLGVHPGSAWLQDVLKAAYQRFAGYEAQDFGSTIWAVARFSFLPNPQWMHEFLQYSYSKLDQMDNQAISNLIWSLASMDYHPPMSWLQRMERVTMERLPQFNPQCFANVTWGLCKLQYCLSSEWQQLCLQQMRLHVHRFSPQELSMVVFSIAKLAANDQCMPQSGAHTPIATSSGAPIVAQLCSSLAVQLHQLRASEAACGLWGIAMLQQHPGSDKIEHWLAASASTLSYADGKSLANIGYALQKLHSCAPITLPGVWLDAYLTAVAGHMGTMGNRSASVILYSLARLGVRPSQQWLAAFMASSVNLLPACNPSELMNLSCALAQMRCKPPAYWRQTFHEQMAHQLPVFTSKEASNTILALAKMGQGMPLGILQQVQGRLQSGALPVSHADLQQLGKAWQLMQLDDQWIVDLRAHAVPRPQR